MNKIVLIIGGNMGDKIGLINQADLLINQLMGVILKRSSLFESEAWGGVSVGNYINQVLVVESSRSPNDILKLALEIENSLERKRDQKWGDRTMDIDILYYNNEIIDTKDLKVPHPYIADRRFVLTPLQEILPDWIHPVFKVSNQTLLKQCKDFSLVRKL